MNASKLFEQELAEIPPEVKKQMELSFAISDKIASIIDKKGISQKEFAKLVGCTESEICRWLGGTHNFTIRTIARISTALEVDLINVSE